MFLLKLISWTNQNNQAGGDDGNATIRNTQTLIHRIQMCQDALALKNSQKFRGIKRTEGGSRGDHKGGEHDEGLDPA